MTAPARPRRRKDSGVGARLRQMREARGMTKADVARRMGADPATVWTLEDGRVDPRFSTLLRYCNAIGAHIHIGLPDQAHTDTTSKETA